MKRSVRSTIRLLFKAQIGNLLIAIVCIQTDRVAEGDIGKAKDYRLPYTLYRIKAGIDKRGSLRRTAFKKRFCCLEPLRRLDFVNCSIWSLSIKVTYRSCDASFSQEKFQGATCNLQVVKRLK